MARRDRSQATSSVTHLVRVRVRVRVGVVVVVRIGLGLGLGLGVEMVAGARVGGDAEGDHPLAAPHLDHALGTPREHLGLVRVRARVRVRGSNAVKSAALEAARSSTRGGDGDPSGRSGGRGRGGAREGCEGCGSGVLSRVPGAGCFLRSHGSVWVSTSSFRGRLGCSSLGIRVGVWRRGCPGSAELHGATRRALRRRRR